jgi:putative pyruvate formate lyase activating enzyme
MTTPQTGSFAEFHCCTSCPRECRARRLDGQLGYCRSGPGFGIGAICVHRGEEPVLVGRPSPAMGARLPAMGSRLPAMGAHGIANVFFTHCNMQCLYCQNHQISRNRGEIIEHHLELPEVVERIERLLGGGVRTVGFVSPSHCIPQMKAILSALQGRQPKPIFVMNTNSYDKVETLASLEGAMDVYLPDLKYMDADLAARYSDAPDYPDVAARAIQEMFRQKGSRIEVDDAGYIESGLIIRHLVLPGQVENSKRCLRWIADHLSTDVHVSLMAQYHPTPAVADHPELGRRVRPEEYQEVLDELERLGFHRGWTQELDSPSSYQPDFAQSHPFEW